MAVPGVHHMLARPRMLVYVLLGIGRTTATLRSQRVRGLIYSYRRCFDMACMPQNLILFLTVIHSIIHHLPRQLGYAVVVGGDHMLYSGLPS